MCTAVVSQSSAVTPDLRLVNPPTPGRVWGRFWAGSGHKPNAVVPKTGPKTGPGPSPGSGGFTNRRSGLKFKGRLERRRQTELAPKQCGLSRKPW